MVMNTSHADRVLGIYFKDIGNLSSMSLKEEMRLGSLSLKGDKAAFNKLVRSNLKFVVAVAKIYRHHGLPLADLVAEGNLGLIRAVRRYNPAKRVKVISHAIWWIRQSILLALAENGHRLGRVPVYHISNVAKVTKAASSLEQEKHDKATIRDISERCGLSEFKVRCTLQLSKTPVSMDTPRHGNDTGNRTGSAGTISDCVKSHWGAPETQTDANDIQSATESILAFLDPKERRALELYCGIGIDGQRLNYRDIGHIMGISHERVRQLKNRAVERISHASRAERLKDFKGVVFTAIAAREKAENYASV